MVNVDEAYRIATGRALTDDNARKFLQALADKYIMWVRTGKQIYLNKIDQMVSTYQSKANEAVMGANYKDGVKKFAAKIGVAMSDNNPMIRSYLASLPSMGTNYAQAKDKMSTGFSNADVDAMAQKWLIGLIKAFSA